MFIANNGILKYLILILKNKIRLVKNTSLGTILSAQYELQPPEKTDFVASKSII